MEMYLQCGSVIDVQRLLCVLRAIVVVKVDTSIVDQDINFAFSLHTFGESLNAIIARDVEFWEDDAVGF